MFRSCRAQWFGGRREGRFRRAELVSASRGIIMRLTGEGSIGGSMSARNRNRDVGVGCCTCTTAVPRGRARSVGEASSRCPCPAVSSSSTRSTRRIRQSACDERERLVCDGAGDGGSSCRDKGSGAPWEFRWHLAPRSTIHACTTFAISPCL